MVARTFRPLDYLLLVGLAAIWGGSFPLIKVAVASIPPMTLVAGRLALAAVGLLVFLAATGRRLPSEPWAWRDFGVIALVGNLVPFLLISWGEQEIASGLAAILMAIMPLATLILAHLYTRDERLSLSRLGGVLVGLAGIVVLVGPGALAGFGREVVAQVAVAFAACCYAISSVYTRTSRLVALPAAVIGAGVLLCASLLAVPLSLFVDQPWRLDPTARSVVALIALALLSTSVAYLILFRLLATTSATFVAFNNYLVPIFGVLLGSLFLGEALRASAFLALGLILAGLALAQGRRRVRPPPAGDSC